MHLLDVRDEIDLSNPVVTDTAGHINSVRGGGCFSLDVTFIFYGEVYC